MRQNSNAQCDRKSKRRLASAVFLLCAVSLNSQAVTSDAALQEIRAGLMASLKYENPRPVVFVGEISRMGPAYHGICKEAVSRDVEFTISNLLLGTYTDPLVRTSYIDCGSMTSPPFTLHAKVIVYCDQQDNRMACALPAALTDENLKKVESWIAARQRHHHANTVAK